MISPTPDTTAIFGFTTGFFTLIAISYSNQFRTKLPLMSIGLIGCAAYAFLTGIWPIGFCLIALAVKELRPPRHATPVLPMRREIASQSVLVDSRLTRMFGSGLR
jgi:hypothetical protein